VREGVEAPHHQESVAEDLEIKECLSSQSSYSNDGEEAKQDQKEVIPEHILRRREICQKVHTRFLEVVATRDQDSIVNDFNKGAVTVRRRVVNSDTGINLFILERTDLGVTPADFLRILEKTEYYAKANSNLSGIDLITVEDLQNNGATLPVEVYAS